VAKKEKEYYDDAEMKEWFKAVVKKIRTEEDPFELNRYRTLFRKNVPFTLRSYFTAYLLKEMKNGTLDGKAAFSGDNRSSRNKRLNRSEARAARKKERTDERNVRKSSVARSVDQSNIDSRPVLADDVSTTLFVSIGRNRRVFPRDLIGLIMQNVEIDREHIGDIRILDNYSFVQVITEDAERIISTLNEFEYRGRRLVVSYSRKKEDAGDEAGSEETSPEANTTDNKE